MIQAKCTTVIPALAFYEMQVCHKTSHQGQLISMYLLGGVIQLFL